MGVEIPEGVRRKLVDAALQLGLSPDELMSAVDWEKQFPEKVLKSVEKSLDGVELFDKALSGLRKKVQG